MPAERATAEGQEMNHKRFALALVGIFLPASELNAAQPSLQSANPAAAECASIVATGVPQITSARVASVYAIGKKGEYDTIAAYLGRLRKLVGDGRIITSVPIPSEYDAGRRTISVATSHFTTDTMDLDALPTDSVSNFEFQALSSSTKYAGSYVDRQAVGGNSRIRSDLETQLGVAWKIARSEDLASPDLIAIPASSPAQAALIRNNLRILIAGRITPPYTFRGVDGSYTHGTRPTDRTTYKYAVAAAPHCGVVYDGQTGKVYASWGIGAN